MAEQPTRSAAPSAAETGSISPSGDATLVVHAPGGAAADAVDPARPSRL